MKHLSPARVLAFFVVALAVAQLPIGNALRAGTLAAPDEPKLGTLHTYKDWVIGCDNVQRCIAESLPPAAANWQPPPGADSDVVYVIGIRRDAGPNGLAEVWFPVNNKAQTDSIDFGVDGRQIASALIEKGAATVRGAQAAALVAAMTRGMTMEVKARDKVLGRPSLAGSAAAVREMDARQGRDGTTTALVATGARSAQTVKAAPPLPIINRIVPDPALKAEPLAAEEQATAIKVGGCLGVPEGIDVAVLSGTQTLVLVTCDSGPYNSNSSVLVGTGATGRRRFVLATFDYKPGYGASGSGPILVNGGWDATTARLHSNIRGRGLGDCGSSENFVWDGAMFRLVEATVMDECRGSYDWITVWRATPKP